MQCDAKWTRPVAVLVALVAVCLWLRDVSAAAPDEVADRAAQTESHSTGGRTLSGRVVFRGTPPARKAINMVKDPECLKLHGDKPLMDEEILVTPGGGLQNAFVYVRNAPKMDYSVPEEPARLTQQGCMFRPRVQGVRVGQRLLIANDDRMTHNVRSFPTVNRAFNFGQPADTEPRERLFERAEREIEVQCDFHPWMHAYLFAMDHPFFSVSDADGGYAIVGLPPGDFTLEVWHEKLGKQRKTVTTLGDSELVDVNFTFPR
jgi:hypothetical protein